MTPVCGRLESPTTEGFTVSFAKGVWNEITRSSTKNGGKGALRKGVSAGKDATVGKAANWLNEKTAPVKSAAFKGMQICPVCGKRFKSNKANVCSSKCARTGYDGDDE